jgi:hypothetical protein
MVAGLKVGHATEEEMGATARKGATLAAPFLLMMR